MLFTFKIWDKKKITVFEDGDWVEVPHPTDTDWIKREVDIETDLVRITGFQEDEIYADEVKSKNCTRVFFNDGDEVFAAYTKPQFKKIYNEEYLPLIPKDLSDIVRDLEGDKPN